MSNELDVPSVEVLEKLHEEHLALGIQFKLAGLHSPVQKMLDASGLTEVIGPKNIHATVLEAVLSYTAENFDRIRDEITEDDIETIINRIDTLTEIFGYASERVSETHQERVGAVIDRLAEARSRLEGSGSEEIAEQTDGPIG